MANILQWHRSVDSVCARHCRCGRGQVLSAVHLVTCTLARRERAGATSALCSLYRDGQLPTLSTRFRHGDNLAGLLAAVGLLPPNCSPEVHAGILLGAFPKSVAKAALARFGVPVDRKGIIISGTRSILVAWASRAWQNIADSIGSLDIVPGR